MYKVVEFFTDLQDNNYPYQVGDVFPHEGLEVSQERLAELSGTKNRRGIALIEEVAEDAPNSENSTSDDGKIESEAKPTKKRKKANKEN